ncbi:TRPM8 channel-associated factor 2 [Rhinophrynus dorsalis]
MGPDEDYRSLVKDISSLDFRGKSFPCKLLLTGDSVFPVLVTPGKDVLIAASHYGKGRVVVMGHESYLSLPQFEKFLQNAVSWLSSSQGAVVGVHSNLSFLEKTLSASGFKVQVTSVPNQGLGVFCTTGYEDSQAEEVIAFVREGGGLLTGAQARQWVDSHKHENVLQQFPGNKVISVSGVYFTDQYAEIGKFNLSKNIPRTAIYTPWDFSADLKQLLKGVTHLDISGESIPSELLLHGSLAFPVGLSNTNQCFMAAAYYGKGRVVVASHEDYLTKPELKTFILNAISWLDMRGTRKIGVNKDLKKLAQILQNESIPCMVSNMTPGLTVYCCQSYNDDEAKDIQQFVAEGGGLLIAGHAWYWSYQNPEVLSQYPGNRILNKFGISILGRTVPQGIYKAIDSEAATEQYNFRRAFDQLHNELQSGAELKPPLSSWLFRLREDISTFMKLPASPLITSIQSQFVDLVKRFKIPNVSKKCPVNSNSKEALILCLAQDVSCLSQSCEKLNNLENQASVTMNIDATNPGDDAWRSTGLYLAPGKTALFVFPASAVGKNLQVQVGCHSDDLSSEEKFCRAPIVVYKTRVVGEKILVSSVWGGLLYIIVKAHSNLGIIPITVHGADPAPTYIKGTTSLSSWLESICNLKAPWAELITENIILSLPSDEIRSLKDPEALLSLWDKIMEAVAQLASIPKKFPRPERIVADVQISAGWMHSGYPIMCHLESARELVDINNMQKVGLWGAIHELGHNEQRNVWEFYPHTTEATCNLWSVYVHETVFGILRDQAHSELQPKNRIARIQSYLKTGPNLEHWNVWTALETYLQLQEGFGWDPFKRVFAEYQTMDGIKDEKKFKMNLWVEKFSQAVNRNLVPFFQAWGWPIEDQTSRKLSTLPAWDKDPMKLYIASE